VYVRIHNGYVSEMTVNKVITFDKRKYVSLLNNYVLFFCLSTDFTLTLIFLTLVNLISESAATRTSQEVAGEVYRRGLR
jgi:hypothetical protein